MIFRECLSLLAPHKLMMDITPEELYSFMECGSALYMDMRALLDIISKDYNLLSLNLAMRKLY